MADLSEAQRKRQEARRRRRGQSEESPQQDASTLESGEQPLESVKQAAKVAAAGAAVGAAAAAARALTHRDDQGAEDGDESAQAEQQERQKGPRDQESEAQPEPQHEPQAEQEQEPQAKPEPEPQAQEQEQEEQEPVEGAELGDARETMRRAREQLEELLGKPVESASSLERTHDGWVVTLEVVELKRIPESTDVLAAYELELDESLGFRRYQQVRRYTRSQADRGEQ